LPPLAIVVALAPAAAVPISSAWAKLQAPPQAALQRAVGLPMNEPFGLSVSPGAVASLRGGLPPGVPRPDLEAGAVSVTELQSALRQQAGPRLERCFQHARETNPAISGELVVSVAVAVGREPIAIVAGPAQLRRALSSCVVTAFEGVDYPSPRREALWFHYPVRFAG
jgi:hypothetical protein